MFRIEFETSGAAFDEMPQAEVSRILQHVAHEINIGCTKGLVRDVNGNTIGKWEIQ